MSGIKRKRKPKGEGWRLEAWLGNRRHEEALELAAEDRNRQHEEDAAAHEADNEAGASHD